MSHRPAMRSKGPSYDTSVPILPLKASGNDGKISFRVPGQLALEQLKLWRRLMVQRATHQALRAKLAQCLSKLGGASLTNDNIRHGQHNHVTPHYNGAVETGSIYSNRTERSPAVQLDWERALEYKWAELIRRMQSEIEQENGRGQTRSASGSSSHVDDRAPRRHGFFSRTPKAIDSRGSTTRETESESRRRRERLKSILDAADALEQEERSVLWAFLNAERNEFDQLLASCDAIYSPLTTNSGTVDVYRGLGDHEIRVLILHPAPNRFYPLVGTLKTESFRNGQRPNYSAVSYHWGTDSPAGAIHILPEELSHGLTSASDSPRSANDHLKRYHTVSIQSNLLAMLHRLRRTDGPVALWVDKLCINQDNPIEKTKQLSMIPYIYQSSHSVRVWLGESDDEGRSDLAMQFIPSVVDIRILKKLVTEKKYSRHWAALAELMRDVWFSRRWVIQEIAYAQNAVLHCGGYTVPWCDFLDAIYILVDYRERIYQLFDGPEWRDGPRTLGDLPSCGANILTRTLDELFLKTEEGDLIKPRQRLEYLVTTLTPYETTDPRDLIYSLITIASDTSPLSKQCTVRGLANVSSDVLPLDYRRTGPEVFKDFTQFCINSSGSLDIILRPWVPGVAPNHQHAHLRKEPSWASVSLKSPSDVFNGPKDCNSLVGPLGKPCYAACGGRKAERDPFIGLYLTVTGFQLSVITNLSHGYTADPVTRDSVSLLGWSESISYTRGAPDPVWRTLIADRDIHGQKPHTRYKHVCWRYLSDACNNRDFNISKSLFEDLNDDVREYLTRVREVTWNRRFFVGRHSHSKPMERTSVGTQVGLCPVDTREGDLVCILYGCSVPVILRKHGLRETSYFELIGEAYVYAMMDGEAEFALDEGKTLSKEMQFNIK